VIGLSVFWWWEYFAPKVNSDITTSYDKNDILNSEWNPQKWNKQGKNSLFWSGDKQNTMREGMDPKQMAEKFGIDIEIIKQWIKEGKTINNILEENGIERPSKWDFGTWNNMDKMMDRMMNRNPEDIATKFGIDIEILQAGIDEWKSIRDILEENNIEFNKDPQNKPRTMTGTLDYNNQ